MGFIRNIFRFPQPLSQTYPVIWIIPFVILISADLATKKIATNSLRFNLSYSQAARRLTPHIPDRVEIEGRKQVNVLGQNGKYIKFRLVFNDRFAFSLGPRTPLFGFFISLGAVLFLFLYRAHNPGLGNPLAWLIIFSGAIGNLIDKMFIKSLTTGDWVFSLLPRKGYVNGVVDFIECIWFGVSSLRDTPVLSVLSWPTWPSFNLADSLVSTGIVILLLTLKFDDAEVKASSAPAKSN